MTERFEAEVYAAMVSAVKRITRKMAKGNWQPTEDQLQASMVAALEALPHWDKSRDLEAFLYWPVVGAMADQYKEEHPQDMTVSIHEGSSSEDENGDTDSETPFTLSDCLQYDSPPEGYGNPETEAYYKQIRDILATLPPEANSMLLAYYGIGQAKQTLQEMSDALGIPVSSLQRSIQYAIQDLRMVLEGRKQF